VRIRRGAHALERDLAAVAIVCFGYWLIHGAVDWFWEFAGLGSIAFAALGLAMSLGDGVSAPGGQARTGRLSIAVALACALVAGLSLAAPWLSERYIHQAGSTWRSDPDSAFRSLDRARSLNPLSATPDLTAGTIAVELGRLAVATDHFKSALRRDPTLGYAHLELGAIASQQGRRAEALRRLRRAVDLNPRYSVSLQALRAVRQGKKVKPAEVNRRIVRATRARIGIE
jgi:tetratricopeptide (TPR) repeat protein